MVRTSGGLPQGVGSRNDYFLRLAARLAPVFEQNQEWMFHYLKPYQMQVQFSNPYTDTQLRSVIACACKEVHYAGKELKNAISVCRKAVEGAQMVADPMMEETGYAEDSEQKLV